MSKELVISAASHERRVAILEEGQLVEIYIEREKEFALVGSIYKGRVTRVLPGMQSAFVDIGLDGDAFLYVSDVFENLEDYDHGHGQAIRIATARRKFPRPSRSEVLPGETIGQGDRAAAESHEGEEHHDEQHDGHEHGEAHADAGPETHGEEHHEHHDDEHRDDHEHDNIGNVVTPGKRNSAPRGVTPTAISSRTTNSKSASRNRTHRRHRISLRTTTRRKSIRNATIVARATIAAAKALVALRVIAAMTEVAIAAVIADAAVSDAVVVAGAVVAAVKAAQWPGRTQSSAVEIRSPQGDQRGNDSRG